MSVKFHQFGKSAQGQFIRSPMGQRGFKLGASVWLIEPDTQIYWKYNDEDEWAEGSIYPFRCIYGGADRYFVTTKTSPGGYMLWALDGDGTKVWRSDLVSMSGSPGNDILRGVGVLSDGTIAVCGRVFSGANVWIIAADGQSIVASRSAIDGTNALSLVVDSNDNILVSSSTRVGSYSADLSTENWLMTTVGGYDVALESNNKAWVTHANSGSPNFYNLSQIDTAGSFGTRVNVGAAQSDVSGISVALDSLDFVFATSHETSPAKNYLTKINTAGVQQWQTTEDDTASQGNQSIAADNDGNVLVPIIASASQKSITRYTAAAGALDWEWSNRTDTVYVIYAVDVGPDNKAIACGSWSDDYDAA